MLQTGHEFTTIFERNLIAEIPNIAHRPCLVVTMPDLWPKFGHLLGSQCVPYFALIRRRIRSGQAGPPRAAAEQT